MPSKSGPESVSNLIFPTAATSLSETLSSLKRSALSISNRLKSVSHDAEFVQSVASAWKLPLVANERCGGWYIHPSRRGIEGENGKRLGGSAYFKSTDGHTGEWAFSQRRLNLQVLDVVGRAKGCIIVDSTRRGKSMPDALSKTVPIWCAVMNRVLYPDKSDAHGLHTPPQVVSRSEHAQIEARLDGFVRQLQELSLNLEELRGTLAKPMRPVWVTADSEIPEDIPEFEDAYPVVLCTASRRVPGGEVSEGGYVQGAGDDSEGWGHGLTSALYWEHKDLLMSTDEEDLPHLIEGIIAESRAQSDRSPEVQIKPTTWLSVGTLDTVRSAEDSHFDGVIYCSEESDQSILSKLSKRSLHLECGENKLGSRDLRRELPKISDFFQKQSPFEHLIVCCDSGKDISIGVALAVLCLYADSQGKIISHNQTNMNKSFIRQRLSWIMSSYPEANPSRSTLNSVNSFLMS
ncbi:tRNA a64-2'-O-ribosylphosphate transferase, partial [Aulographum hederae CBS 113979]